MISCNDDEPTPDPIPDPTPDPEPIEVNLTIDDFEASIDENIVDGTTIGMVSFATDTGVVVLTLSNETPAGALALDGTTGALSVLDATIFDFEANEQITATVTATVDSVVAEAEVTVLINDLFELETQVFVEQTGDDNPFDGLDFGTDSYLSTADIDDDGDLDVIVGTLSGTLQYLENVSGVFTTRTGEENPFEGIDVGSDSRHTFADWDEDGDLDLISGNGNGDILQYENQNGTFNTTATGFRGYAKRSIDSKPTFHDYDGDGDLDMLVGFFNQIGIYVKEDNGFYLDNADITFSAVLNPTHQFPTFVDIDGDEQMDLVVGRYSGDFSLYKETSDGTYVLVDTFDLFENLDVGSYSGPAFIDLDDDGILEMLSGNGEGVINCYKMTTRE